MSELIPITFLDKVEVAFADMKSRIIKEMGETMHLHYAVQEARDKILTATAEHFPPVEETEPGAPEETETKAAQEPMPADATPGIEDKAV